VDTKLDAKFKEKGIELQGGYEKAVPPMPLKEYMDSAIARLEKEDLKEIVVGFSQMGVDAWRGAFWSDSRESRPCWIIFRWKKTLNVGGK
jgi:uncharacterized oxidoreductase